MGFFALWVLGDDPAWLGPARLAFDLAQGDYLSNPPNVKPPITQEERYDRRTK